MSKMWTKTAKAIGAIDIESEADGVYFTKKQVDDIEAALPDADSDLQKKSADQKKTIQDLTKAVNDSKEALAAAQTTISTLTKDKETLTAQVTELSKKPGGAPTTIVKPADENASTKIEESPREKTAAEKERDSLAGLRSWNFGVEKTEA